MICVSRRQNATPSLPLSGEPVVPRSARALRNQHDSFNMGRDNTLNIGSTGEQVIPPCMREHIHPGRNMLLPFQLTSKFIQVFQMALYMSTFRQF